MRTRALVGITTLVLSVAGIVPVQAATPVQARPGSAGSMPTFAPDRILVVPRSDAGPRPLAGLNDALGGQVRRVLAGSTVREVRLPEGLSVLEAVSRYEASDVVAYAEPDFVIEQADLAPVTPNDPDFALAYGLDNRGQTAGTPDADIDAPEAWATTTGKAQTVVAVIDTGVDVSHPDLRDNIWRNPGEIAGNSIDDDQNGYVDDVTGWDFYHNDNSVFDNADDDSHGTHVAGIVAARGDNGVGGTGVAWRASLMPLKFLGDNGSGFVSDSIEALDYAVANGARVSNNSWGGASYSQALRDAIKRAGGSGHLFVAAAGNGGADGIGDNLDVTPEYPAAYPEPNILTVTATDHADTLASFSNYGAVQVDLAAPGVRIVSTVPGNRYALASGTSMATPFVTGAATLLLGIDGTQTAAELKGALMTSVDMQPGLVPKTLTGGRLGLAAAVLQVSAPAVTDPAPPPSPAPLPSTEPAPAPGPEPAPTPEPAPDPADPEPVVARMTLTSTRAALVFGGEVDFSGTLDADGAPVSGERVVLQQRLVGREWTYAETTEVVTRGDGGFTFWRLRPIRNADYRVRFAGNESRSLAPAQSVSLRVNVRVRMTLGRSFGSLPVGNAQRVFGRVAPRSLGEVRVVILREGTVVERTRVSLDRQRFTHTYRPKRSGRYVVRVIRAGDLRNLGVRKVSRFRVTRG